MTKIKEIRTGVIGVGSMGQNHARVYSEISDLTSVSDPNEKQGKRVAKRFGAKYFPNFEDMLSEVDAVSISVPTSLHEKVSERVAEAGVNMLVEKPLAHSSLAAQKIIDVAAKNDVVLAVGHIERFNEVVTHAKEAISNKKWGNIISLSANRFSNYPSRISDVGVLFDLTIHDVDIICSLANSEVTSVSVIGGKYNNEVHEDYVNLSLSFEDGKIGQCQTNWLTPMKVRELNLITTNSFININYIDQEILQLKSNFIDLNEANLYDSQLEVNESRIRLKGKEPLKLELSNFLESIIQKTEPAVPGIEGLKAVQIVEAGLESLLNNKVISLK